ncbi:DMT family transporter [Candidatus Woesearchaeota archaeon]|nr:DMT family transporter [Candidatus Woesearchaeota archaeon]
MKDWIIFSLVAMVLWGLWAFLPKLASAYIDPRSILVYDVIGTFIVGVVVFFIVQFKPAFHMQGTTLGILTGIAGTLGLLFFLFALQRGATSLVVTTTALYPVVTILLASILLKEPVTLKQGLGVLLAIVAIILMSS